MPLVLIRQPALFDAHVRNVVLNGLLDGHFVCRRLLPLADHVELIMLVNLVPDLVAVGLAVGEYLVDIDVPLACFKRRSTSSLVPLQSRLDFASGCLN